MNLTKLTHCFLTCMLITSCASTHNLKTDGPTFMGGGYHVSESDGGGYRIYTKSNASPWTNFGSVRDTWENLAEEKCGDSGYTELDVDEYSYELQPAMWGMLKYLISVKRGIAVCNTTSVNATE